jgi:CHAT domain
MGVPPLHPFLWTSSSVGVSMLWGEAHDLLSDDADRVAGQFVAAAAQQGDPVAAKRRQERRQVLRYCQELGIEEVTARMTQLQYEARVVTLIGQAIECEGDSARDWPALFQAMLDQTSLEEGSAARALSIAAVRLRTCYADTDAMGYLDGAIWCWREAVARTPPGSRDRLEDLSNLGMSLALRHQRTKHEGDLQAAIRAWQQSCAQGLDIAPDLVLEVAILWAQLAKGRDAWAEAATAYGYGLDAVERLVQVQLARRDKETRLRETRGLTAAAAYAFAKAESLQPAVLVLERGRAVLLTESLEAWRADLSRLQQERPELAELAQRYEQAAARMQELEWRSTNPIAPLPTMAQRHEDRTKLDQAIADIQQRFDKEFLAGPTFGRIAEAARNVPLVYLATTGDGGLALIVAPDGSVERVWLPDLTPEAFNATVAGVHQRSSQRMAELAQQYLDDLDDRSKRDEDMHEVVIKNAMVRAGMEFQPEVTRWLWDAAMGPLLTSGLPLSRMVLLPSGPLGVWPLHAAWTEDATAPTGRRYALDEACITYTPNARMLRQAQLVAAGTAGDTIVVIEGTDLEYSGQEAELVMAAFPSGSGQHLEYTTATREGVLAALQKASVAHFCCHGNANPDNPLATGLHIARGVELTVRDVLEQRLTQARLAVLSACEINLPGIELPEEAMSLPAVMLHAGFGAVIGPLQKVPDDSTMVLMARFYELWRGDHINPPEALRQAQRWVRDSTAAQLRYRFSDVHRINATTSWDGIPSGEVRPFAHEMDWAAFAYIGV